MTEFESYIHVKPQQDARKNGYWNNLKVQSNDKVALININNTDRIDFLKFVNAFNNYFPTVAGNTPSSDRISTKMTVFMLTAMRTSNPT
jgi:hypothetical protein